MFLQEFGGCTPTLTEIQPTIQICMDAMANLDLDWGTWYDQEWMYQKWDKDFLDQEQPSIDFLELYAVVVAVYAWNPKLINKSMEFFSDNTPTVQVINDAFSRSPNLMHLLHFLTLHCMLNNIKLTAFFIPGDKNDMLILYLIFSSQGSGDYTKKQMQTQLLAQHSSALYPKTHSPTCFCSFSLLYS